MRHHNQKHLYDRIKPLMFGDYTKKWISMFRLWKPIIHDMQSPYRTWLGAFAFLSRGYMLSRKLKGTHATFQTSNFTSTKWNTAEDKARMANKLTKFILNGFQQTSFTKEMYKRLSSMFGHIAEYDIQGFYHVWFQDDAACLRWAKNAMRGGVLGFVVGDPAWTWSDVEKAIQQWMTDNRIIEQIQYIDNSESSRLPEEPQQDHQLTLFRGSITGVSKDQAFKETS